MNGRLRKGVVSAVLTASMVTCGMPTVSIAAQTASLADARARFEELALASAEVGESLNDTKYALEQTRASIGEVTEQIDAAEAALDEARDVLAARVAANYRAGGRTLLDMVMGSSTLDELVGAVYYADKVAERDAAAIDAVKTAESELEEQKTSLETLEQSQQELVTQQEQQAAALEEAQAEQAAYIKGLDAPVRTELEQARAADIAAQQAAAARAIADQQATPDAPIAAPLDWKAEDNKDNKDNKDEKPASQAPVADASDEQAAPETTPAQTETAQTETVQTESAPTEEPAQAETAAPEQTPESAPEAAPAPEAEPEPAPAETPAEEPAPAETTTTEDTSSSESSSDDYRATILEAAYSQLGVPYVYGAESPGVALDCSGFTQYCYSQAGIDIPHSSVAQASMADHTSLDELQAGDLVFWEGTAGGSASGSHVAIYLGDGQIIHANGTEVAVGTLSNSWTSCGSIS